MKKLKINKGLMQDQTDSEWLKYRFRINVPLTATPIQQGGKHISFTVGCASEETRKEWVLLLQVLQNC